LKTRELLTGEDNLSLGFGHFVALLVAGRAGRLELSENIQNGRACKVWVTLVLFLATAWVSLLLPSAALAQTLSAISPKPSLVWPPAPEPTRIEYLQSYGRAKDFGWKRSIWRKFVDWAMNETDPSLLQKPFAVVVDSQGRLIIADIGSNEVKIFDTQKKSVKALHGFKGKAFGAPVCLALDGDDNIYVGDSASGHVLKYSPQGKFLAFIGGEEGAFKRPASMVYNPRNRQLYILDTTRPRIFIYSDDGRMVARFGERGIGPGEFNYPTFLALDRQGNIYVNDTLNFRIQVFSPEGKYLSQFGEAGDGSGSINRPKGIAFDSEGHLYISEALFSTVQIFDPRGQYLLSFGEGGRGPGEFYIPAGIAIDASDHIYVADPFQSRIELFQYHRGGPAEERGRAGGGR
jgi:DNA-binding beta-propeller fold protein YncE